MSIAPWDEDEDIDDVERDAIWDDAKDAAINAWGPLGSPTHRPCPYPALSERSEIWWNAFHLCYAKENGK